jgi:hypothetical protein
MFKKSLIVITILILVLSGGILVYASFLDKEEPTKPVDNTLSNDTLEPNDNNEDNQNQDKTDNDISEIDISDWKTYINEEYGFEVKYPEDWQFNETKGGLEIYSFQPTMGYGIGALPENQFKIEIWHWDFLSSPENLNIVTWCDKELGNYNSSSQKRIFSRQEKIINNINVSEIEFELEKNKHINGKFVCFAGEKNNAIILGHPLESKHMGIFDQILSTTKLINP